MKHSIDKVSIIIPCYNYGIYLADTLKSVLNQKHDNWECIIVDDGSTDHTSFVAKEFLIDKRFVYIYQENKGLSAARNKGLSMAEGQYIQLLDSDDLIHPCKLMLQLEGFQKDNGADIIYGSSVYFNASEDIHLSINSICNDKAHNPETRKSKLTCRELLVNNIMPVSAPMIRSNVIKTVGLFNESLKSYEDWEYWFRCLFHGFAFRHFSDKGTETYIRKGHLSMMTNKRKLTESAIVLRKWLIPSLSFSEKIYNQYRLSKLYLRHFLNWYS